jgi:saccharopine dehydrogenase-like NADP-dependent oxidoreductase
MTRFLILGAGFVAEPVIEYLSRNGNNLITLTDVESANTQKLKAKYPLITTQQLNVSDKPALNQLVANTDIVISLVPAPLHPLIAEICIENKVHLLTASYESDGMRKLAQVAKDRGIIILNEMGLDPGIDHLSAMEIIDKVHANGDEILSFTSWCGGIPAPDNNDNPLGYKFSWEPRGALMALCNDAIYLQDNEIIEVKGKDLLLNKQAIIIENLKLEGYPNRESISYQKIYGIPSAKNILRGTLRYQGFSQIFHDFKQLGLLNPKTIQSLKNTSWKDFILQLNHQTDLNLLKKDLHKKTWIALEWLGCLSDISIAERISALDVFCDLLLQKLKYQPKEKDMVILQHQFEIKKANGSVTTLSTVLKQIGEPEGYSAMAKTVGYPIAMAAQLIADGHIINHGLLLPVTQEFYQPILKSLADEGIEFKEKATQNHC